MEAECFCWCMTGTQREWGTRLKILLFTSEFEGREWMGNGLQEEMEGVGLCQFQGLRLYEELG